ncbi:DNA primase [Psychrobacter sp. I-STPA10]|uniref:DNA primase n=1 Tax=Psychrobacter sp. I-STPA10 TaxID=2585769 RepID=UPI001E543E25|nr:DNA primase [Psychrobacter sp. I-STPA10]
MSIPNHVLDQLCSQADLVSIIGRHTTLKRAGREYKGCCPFHGEKTPSFYVNPQKNVYNCFGCGVGGNAISFLRDYENLTFLEAIKELSQQTGIDLPKEDRQDIRYTRRPSNPQPTPPIAPTQTSQNLVSADRIDGINGINHIDDYYDSYGSGFDGNDAGYSGYEGYDNYDSYNSHDDAYFNASNHSNRANDHHTDLAAPQAAHKPASNLNQGGFNQSGFNQGSLNKEGNLYELLERIQVFYQHNLQQHGKALAYFKNRGLSDDTIATFALGYAPAGWQHLEQHFSQDIEGLRALGLVRSSEKGTEYDLLRDRVIFPIRDNQGRTIGFAGRALDNEVKPKYINSSDSPVFHKQHVLYGYYESRQQRCNDWLVVEGYMDVIALYQAGIYGAVASMGTATNESQIARLLQMNPTLTLCFDGDSAGQKAAWRTLEVSLPILSDEKELRFLTLPNNHDPDTYVQTHGVEAMRSQIRHAIPLSEYIFAYLSAQYDLSLVEGKAKLMAQVRSLTSQLPKKSSFRYLLNNDIYQRLGGKRNQKTAAHDALLDFDSDMTISGQLELCLLFDPQRLAEDPIRNIWQRSKVDNIELPDRLKQTNSRHSAHHQHAQIPELPSWQSFDNIRLSKLIEVIQRLLPFLPNDTNAAAHFILANLPNSFQQPLAQRWQVFFQSLTHRGIIDVDDLTEDLLIQLLLQAFNKQVAAANNVVILSHVNRQRQQLITWHKQQQAEQVAKV